MPAGRHPTHRTPLERKLELLEARFSQDPVGGSTSAASASQHSFSFDGSLSNPAANSSRLSSTTAGLDRVQKATERHLHKVQQKVVVWASDASNNSSSTNVMANHHHHHHDNDDNNNRVVPDTPESQVATGKKENAKQVGALKQEKQPASRETTNTATTNINNIKKRKSIPVRREEPSVKENVANAAAATTGAAPSTKARGNNKNNNNPPVLRKRNRTRSPVKDRKKNHTENSQPATSSTTETTTTATLSPPRTSHQGEDGATTSNTGKRTRKQTGPSNNTTIRNFFLPIPSQKTKATKTVVTPSTPLPEAKTDNPSTTVVATPQPARRPSTTVVATPPIERLERRVRELEQACSDKDQQLKAVADNRTILHTALQSALATRTKELEDAKASHRAWRGSSQSALEALVREKATQEAKEVRERLAADGARLGRITYSRAGMRVVETWEEGFASNQLLARRQALKERKALLLERNEKANQIAQKVTEWGGNENGTLESMEDWNDEEWTVGGVVVRTPLDALEAKESVRFHLQSVHLEEKKVAAEEAALNEEKGAHVRALKRVASEDASRFKSRPKLHDRYLLKRLLGKGGFSEVWRAYDLVELREVAVKIHQLDPRWSDSKKENYTKHVSREYEIHRNVRHPRIVSLFDVFEIDNNSFATVLECCDGTDLDTLLKNRRILPERDARAILLQILTGMLYLSQPSKDGSRQGIIHYDLKPGNILFDEFGDAKITDFGLSKIVDAADSSGGMELTSQGAGTYWYLPPECFMTDDNVRISNKVDVWSLGVIYYQMLFGRRPFGDGQSQDAILNDGTVLNAHDVTFPEKISVSEECKEFIRTCLTYDQSFRPTVAQVCQHAYVLKDF